MCCRLQGRARCPISANCCVSPAERSGKPQPHRYPPRPEGLPELLEAAGNLRAARLAFAFGADAVVEDSVPVTHEQSAPAARAECAAAFRVVHVARSRRIAASHRPSAQASPSLTGIRLGPKGFLNSSKRPGISAPHALHLPSALMR